MTNTNRKQSLSINHFESYLQSLDPTLFGLHTINTVSLSPLTAGHQNINYMIVFNNQINKRFVLRYNPNPIDENERTEAEYKKLVQLQGLHAPRPIYLSKPDFLHSSILIMEFIEGDHKEFTALIPQEIDVLAKAVADIHKVTKNTFSESPGSPANKKGTYYDYLQAMIDSTINWRLEKADPSVYAEDQDVIQQARGKLATLVEENKNAFTRNEFSLLHLDIIPPNVLWENGDITFVDWIALSYGDRAEEVAYIFAINNLDKQFQKTFLEEYQKHITDHTLQERIYVYMLKHKLFDLAWSITMIANENISKTLLNERSYRSLYDERLSLLKQYMKSIE